MSGKIVYHYCSLDTFNLIMSNKTIRLCDSAKTNDYMEKNWIMKFIEDSFAKVIKELEGSSNLKDNDIDVEYFKKFVEDRISEPILVSCFSKGKNKLSQWRAYGDNGRGMAIGFNLEKLELKNNKRLTIQDVIYEEKTQVKQITCIINDYIYSNNIKSNEEFKENFEEFCTVVASQLKNIACYFKSPGFIEEEEKRIIYKIPLYKRIEYEDSIDVFKEDKCTERYSITPVKFYTRDNILVAYSDINFMNCIKDGIIKEIDIGPKSNITETDLRNFLYSQGYGEVDIEISKSNIPYR